ncbi:MAG: hypothetical protein AB1646_07535 [Thermodesulfobacteriota bacterium]
MTSDNTLGNPLAFTSIAVFVLTLLTLQAFGSSYDSFDVVSGLIESPRFKDLVAIQKLRLSADLLRARKLKDSDVSFALLDWGDQYLREPPDPYDRLKRWADLVNDDQLSNLKLPRDFLNRLLVSEYLVAKTSYLRSPPQEKLELLRDLSNRKLLDWSVALSYSRVYAGVILTGSRGNPHMGPLEALRVLKKLKDDGLVEWHYRVPTEALLVAEALALDRHFQGAQPQEKLARLRDLEHEGLITELTRKELEKLPVWRLLAHDVTFLKANQDTRRARIMELKRDKLVSSGTLSDLLGIFRPMVMEPSDTAPMPFPKNFRPMPK